MCRTNVSKSDFVDRNAAKWVRNSGHKIGGDTLVTSTSAKTKCEYDTSVEHLFSLHGALVIGDPFLDSMILQIGGRITSVNY